MAENVAQSVEVPVGISIFGSLITEMAPPDLPEGVSPDNQDIIYLPGEVGSRPALNKIYPQLPLGVTITYVKTFIQANRMPLTIVLDSAGNLYKEDVFAHAGLLIFIGKVAPGSLCTSETANGKEYMVFHNGRVGVDIPRQFDGTYLDRISQDGCGVSPTVTSVALPSVQMAAAGNTLTRNNNYVTGFTATPHKLKVGNQVQISDVPDSNATSVVQTNNASNIQNDGSFWGYDSEIYRSVFSSSTSPLAAFVFVGIGSTIPSTATVLGVAFGANIWLQGPSSPASVAEVALWYQGALLGTAKTPSTPLTVTPTNYQYGGAADQWGTALTPTIVNDSTFGGAISVMLGSERVFINGPFAVQIYYTLSGSGTVANISSIVINNETNPGLALVTTDEPHGLIPNLYISIVGVEPGTVANVSAAQWSARITTLTTAANHNLTPGSVIQVAGVTTSTTGTSFSFDGTFEVESVPSPNQLTYSQVPITYTDPDVINGTASTGAITIAWPVPNNTPTPTYFLVQSAPSPTTFYIQINYSNASWSTGTVGFIWEGIFYVTSVPGPNEFIYQQYGPNGATTAIGTVTPYGQAAPGIHQVVVLFQTRQGYVTAPSPPKTFIANGGQYLQVDDIAIGPENTVARILAFTGAGGSSFFYLPVPAFISGMLVSTATQINDNVTTSAVIDFGDPSLFTGLAIDIPGNDLFDIGVLGPSIGVFKYASRLAFWGERNKITNFLNMGFDGGYLPTISNTPTGWTSLDTYGSLITSPNQSAGGAWRITGGGGAQGGLLQQGAFQDYNGISIVEENTQYSTSFYAVTNTAVDTSSLTIQLYSPSQGLLASAVVLNGDLPQDVGLTNGSFVTAEFSNPLPEVIPADTVLQIFSANLQVGSEIIIDEVELYPTDDPFTNFAQFSYINNLESLDQVTGILGPTDDINPIMSAFEQRDSMYFLTSGGLHETRDLAQSEPSGWGITEISLRCGCASPRSCDKGENFAVWLSSPSVEPGPGLGLYAFTGGAVYKVSQEIQPNFDAINQLAVQTSCVKNDSVNRRIYVAVPIGQATAPNQVLVLDYRELDVASDLVSRPPIHISFTGKMICSDLSRKWTRWNISTNYIENIIQASNVTQLVFCGGNGETPGATPGFGNVYFLNPNKYTDDDYGQIVPYYTTYFFVNHELEQILQVGLHRKLFKRYNAYISGVGQLEITPFADNAANPYPSPPMWPLSPTQLFDIGDGINVSCERCSFKIGSIPLPGQTDNRFNLQKFIITMMQEPISPIRFGAV